MLERPDRRWSTGGVCSARCWTTTPSCKEPTLTGDSNDVASALSAKLDTSVPHSARVWNYWLGGKDNFEADRQVGDDFAKLYPDITVVARSSRALLKRAVTFLAAEAGVRQFLDIGTEMPTAENTHQVAQAVAPESRIVYVDNDPMVLVHARALLTGTPQGTTEYIDAELHELAAILTAAATTTLNLSQPVGLILMNILGHVADLSEAVSIVRLWVPKIHPCCSGGVFVFVDEATEMITSTDVQMRSRGGIVIGSGSGRSGRPFAIPRWGR
jgi:hypothetical protein